jgi:glutathione S-transferase
VTDIPPQYGPANPIREWEKMGGVVDGTGRSGSWKLPLAAFTNGDIEPVSSKIDPGEEKARHEAAYKLQSNGVNIGRFALRGAGTPGRKQFSAPLADPYAEANLNYEKHMDVCLRAVADSLLHGPSSLEANGVQMVEGLKALETPSDKKRLQSDLTKSLAYLRDRVGVPRDMSYPAARQLRAHLNFASDLIMTKL